MECSGSLEISEQTVIIVATGSSPLAHAFPEIIQTIVLLILLYLQESEYEFISVDLKLIEVFLDSLYQRLPCHYDSALIELLRRVQTLLYLHYRLLPQVIALSLILCGGS